MATTAVVQVSPCDVDDDVLMKEVVPLLEQGKLVAIPTETVYGLAANAYDANAVGDIFAAKGRPSDNPLIVHIASMTQLRELVDPSSFPVAGDPVHRLLDKFWPGPLTVIFKKSDKVPGIVTAGLDRVAVRMPAHPVAKRIIELSNLPLAAPSANRSGRPSPTSADHVLYDLGCTEGTLNHALTSTMLGDGCGNSSSYEGTYSGLPCIVDGGSCDFGVESTVIDASASAGPIVLRPGGVTVEQLREVLPNVRVFSYSTSPTSSDEEKKIRANPATPGLKYTHYAPAALVRLAEVPNGSESLEELENAIRNHIESVIGSGGKVGVIHTHNEWRYLDAFLDNENVIVLNIGGADEPKVIARHLFGALRELDELKVSEIVVEGVNEEHEGLAVMNRIRKATASTFLRESATS